MIKKIGFVIEFSMYSILSIAQNIGSWFCNSLLNIFVFSEKKTNFLRITLLSLKKRPYKYIKEETGVWVKKTPTKTFDLFSAIGFW